jgi:hypothetical protein
LRKTIRKQKPDNKLRRRECREKRLGDLYKIQMMLDKKNTATDRTIAVQLIFNISGVMFRQRREK